MSNSQWTQAQYADRQSAAQQSSSAHSQRYGAYSTSPSVSGYAHGQSGQQYAGYEGGSGVGGDGYAHGGAASAAASTGGSANGYGQYYQQGGDHPSRAGFPADTSSPAGRAIAEDRNSQYGSPVSPARSARPQPSAAPASAQPQSASYPQQQQQQQQGYGYYPQEYQQAQQAQAQQQQQQQYMQQQQAGQWHGQMGGAQRSVSGGSASAQGGQGGVYSAQSGASGNYPGVGRDKSSATPTIPSSAAPQQTGVAGTQPSHTPTTAHPNAFQSYNAQSGYPQHHPGYYQQYAQPGSAGGQSYYSQGGFQQQGAQSGGWQGAPWQSDPRYGNIAAAPGYNQAQSQAAYAAQAQAQGQMHPQAQHQAQYAQLYAQQQAQQAHAHAQAQAQARAQQAQGHGHPQAQQQGAGAGYSGLGKRPAEEEAVGAKGKKAKGAKGQEVPAAGPPPPPPKSELHPPKQSGSAWQFFFADRLNEAKAQAAAGIKLNVAEVAKAAGLAYNELGAADKEIYQARAAEAREVYKKEYAAWLNTLTPEEIKKENEFRAGQRKNGKSRKGNLKDPNAPKKPLSAYFLFLKAIRNNAALSRIVFEDALETTRQSMFAAKRWRELTTEQKAPFLRRSEADKAEYAGVIEKYEADAKARARGESPEPMPVAKYSQELVSPTLLTAVLPDATEEQIQEILSTADQVYKAPTKASLRAAGGDHESDHDHQSGSDHNASPAEVAVTDLPQDTEADDSNAVDVGAFMSHDFTNFDLPGDSNVRGSMSGTLPESQVRDVTGDGDDDNDEKELDFNAVFETTPPATEVAQIDNLEPKVETISGAGVSADGKTQFAYSSSTFVSGDFAGVGVGTGVAEDESKAKIEELNEEDDGSEQKEDLGGDENAQAAEAGLELGDEPKIEELENTA